MASNEPAPSDGLERHRKQIEDETHQLAATVPVTIADNDQLQHAGEILVRIKNIMKQIADVMDPVVRAAHLAHKSNWVSSVAGPWASSG